MIKPLAFNRFRCNLSDVIPNHYTPKGVMTMTLFLGALCVFLGAMAILYGFFAVLSFIDLVKKRHFKNWQEGVHVTGFFCVAAASCTWLLKFTLPFIL